MNGTCELCGNKGVNLAVVLFKGRRIYACEKCIERYNLIRISKFSNVLTSKSTSKAIASHRTFQPIKTFKFPPKTGLIQTDEYVLVSNFGAKIKGARESLGLTQEELAKRLKIKVSLIKKIETEKWSPPIELAKKIERELNISIIEKKPEEVSYPKEFLKKSKDQLRLGDYL